MDNEFNAHDDPNDVIVYSPVKHHWFYKHNADIKVESWRPFSLQDSLHLDEDFNSLSREKKSKPANDSSSDKETLVPTESGRYEVSLRHRSRRAVYWEEDHKKVRRCSWFYKTETKARFLPYSEWLAERLEMKYMECVESGKWSRGFLLPLDECAEELQNFFFHGPTSMVQQTSMSCLSPTSVVGVSLALDSELPMRVIHMLRGTNDVFTRLSVPRDDWLPAAHVVFVVHGMGPRCDLRGRTIVECVDELRVKANRLTERHFPNCAGRVEFLPVNWHKKLHSAATGVDQRVDHISLPSVPKLRTYTNDTLVDVLFYSSVKYSQIIVNAVADEIARLKALFLHRWPQFTGKFSLIGHSLGSVITFDLLSHQTPLDPSTVLPVSSSSLPLTVDARQPSVAGILAELGLSEELGAVFTREGITLDSFMLLTDADLVQLGVVMGPRKLLLAQIERMKWGNSACSQVVFPQLGFPVAHFFAIGSPIAIFLTTRGLLKLDLHYRLPTCAAFFNIFHPYDPVAFRIEKFVNPECKAEAVLVTHHKGRKRLHIELRESLSRFSQEVTGSFKSTWKKLNSLTTSYMKKGAIVDSNVPSEDTESFSEQDISATGGTEPASYEEVGQLNQGRRFDYVLQEAPFESINDYLFALQSHACYWESEDTILMILTEIFAVMDTVSTSK